jgi:hypothetical protein
MAAGPKLRGDRPLGGECRPFQLADQLLVRFDLSPESRDCGPDGAGHDGETLGGGLHVESEPGLVRRGEGPGGVGQLVAEHLRPSLRPRADLEGDELRVG